ncbi:MAG: hypothetical protein JWL76_86 [Thermoleophilia bacterium]|nr:hypothetical protein [Thermoleophilia bacterium]
MHGATAADATAKADGGGASAPASNSISAALQSLLNAVNQITAMIGGSSGGGGATSGGGSAPTQASNSAAQIGQKGPMQAAPNQFAAPRSLSQYASLDSKTLLGPNVVNATVQNAQTANMRLNADGSVAKSMFNRVVPEDPAKAQAIVQRLMQSTAKFQDPAAAQAAGYDFSKHKLEGGGLLHVSKPGNGLNLDDPSMLLYRKTGDTYKLIGVVLTASKTAPDLGVGTWHTHFGNTDLMKHIWFTPNDLKTAYQEETPSASVI